MAALTGRTVGITARRRGAEFVEALQRHGATVLHAPTIEIVSLSEDGALRAESGRVLEEGIDVLAVTTGAGFRGWLEAADTWGIGQDLRHLFAGARIIVRGPKAKGAVRGAGLTESWSAPGESNAELVEHLLDAGARGVRIAVQVHGAALPEVTGPLADAGAALYELQPYRWQWPSDLDAVHRLLDGVADGSVDALAFTSAPAAANLLTLADGREDQAEILHSLRAGTVLCACVGAVTAAPLAERGILTRQPERSRLGALAKLLTAELSGT